MPFTEPQKEQYIALLQTKGWQLRDGTIWSPGRGLWLSDAHFGNWSPSQARELFARRAARLEKHKDGLLVRAASENREASWAAEEVIKNEKLA